MLEATSGLRLTEESVIGFPSSCAFASLGDAHRNFHHSLLVRPLSPRKAGQGAQRCPETRVAGGDHPVERGRRRNARDHAPNGQVEDLRLALAGAVHGGRRRWPSA